MDNVINQVSKRLADASSRRGFLSTLGKAVLIASGAGALAATQGTGVALAANCCFGPAYCGPNCPSGTSSRYTWGCCGGRTFIYCDDCYNSQGTLVCVAVTQSSISCNAPAP